MWAPLRLLLFVLLLILLFFALVPKLVVTELVLEDGYAVATVLDCNKPLRGLPGAAVHPFALLPRSRSDGLILLDSLGSAFYSLPAPVSQDGELSLFSGKGGAGFVDGGPAAAMFDHPRSFAVDAMDNVYVADRSNGAIRKISSSGVTSTIAGGYTKKTGHIDGPAQNASFSNDFDIVYVPKLCALLISDRANRLIRQMNLKPEDCAHKSQPGLGVVPIFITAALSVLFGSVLGFFVRPCFACFATHEVSINHFIDKTWKHYPVNQGRLMQMTCSDIRSGVANSMIYVLMVKFLNLNLCYLSVVFRNLRLEKRVQCRETVSHVDVDLTSNHSMAKSRVFADQLRDLISFDEGLGALEVCRSSSKQETVMEDASESSLCKIDDMISANLSDFADQAKQEGRMDGNGACGFGPVKRRPRGVEGM